MFMRITARGVLLRKSAATFTAELLNIMTKSLQPRFLLVRSNWTATGSEAVIRDNQTQDEYVVNIVPRRTNQDINDQVDETSLQTTQFQQSGF